MVDTDQYYVEQFGFRKNHSTMHAITEFVGEISNGYNNGLYTLAIFIDLCKAFDTVDHSRVSSCPIKSYIFGIVL